MAHLNAWCGTVNLATEPELTQITENLNVCRLRACSTVRRRVDGAWSDKPVWLTIEVYGHDANYVARYAHKGSFMAVQGELEYHEWTGQDAQKKSELRVAIDARNGGAVNLGPKQASNGQPAPQTQVRQAPMHAPAGVSAAGRRSAGTGRAGRARARRADHGGAGARDSARRAHAAGCCLAAAGRTGPAASEAPAVARRRAVPAAATAVPAGQDDIPF